MPSCSKVTNGGHTDRQTGDLISLLSFFENKLKIQPFMSVLKLPLLADLQQKIGN
jgi:hypothetical protein